MTPRRCQQFLDRTRFLLRLLDPEDLGHAVTPEVRDEVRRLLLIPEQERPREVAAAVQDE